MDLSLKLPDKEKEIQEISYRRRLWWEIPLAQTFPEQA